MSAKFSPGPWKYQHGVLSDTHGYYITRDVRPGAQGVVARMDGSTMAAFERDANARLIVNAPRLYELVDKLVTNHEVPFAWLKQVLKDIDG